MVDSAVHPPTSLSSSPARRRWLARRLPSPDERRLVVLTGARQTGKTTLARRVYADLRYLNLDDLELRSRLAEVRTTAWARTVGDAVLDEAQKEPSVFEKVKYAFDDRQIRFSALLGSSRVLLLEQVRESLAGRAFVYDLWPLTLSELAGDGGELETPLFGRLLDAFGVDGGGTDVDTVLGDEPELLLGDDEERRLAAFDHLARWGGMPELLRLDDDDRKMWLRSYQQTYMERDLVDLVSLRDLQPFRKLQTLAMLRTGQLLNYSELGRDAQISTSTTRRYLQFLDLTYQVVRLQPFYRNLTSSTIKSPKIYWTDLGLLREGTAQWGPLDGALFETLVVAECVKWVSTLASDARLFYYRTRHGLEVDLLVQTASGIFGLEIKNRDKVARGDARAMTTVAERLGDEWLGGLVVYRGGAVRPLDGEPRTWCVPAHRLLA